MSHLQFDAFWRFFTSFLGFFMHINTMFYPNIGSLSAHNCKWAQSSSLSECEMAPGAAVKSNCCWCLDGSRYFHPRPGNILGMLNISCLRWVTWQQVTNPGGGLGPGRCFLNADPLPSLPGCFVLISLAAHASCMVVFNCAIWHGAPQCPRS